MIYSKTPQMSGLLMYFSFLKRIQVTEIVRKTKAFTNHIVVVLLECFEQLLQCFSP